MASQRIPAVNNVTVEVNDDQYDIDRHDRIVLRRRDRPSLVATRTNPKIEVDP